MVLALMLQAVELSCGSASGSTKGQSGFKRSKRETEQEEHVQGAQSRDYTVSISLSSTASSSLFVKYASSASMTLAGSSTIITNNVLRRGRAKECKQVESSGAFVMETQSGAEHNGQDRIG